MIVGDWLGRREMLTPEKVALVDAARGMRPITWRAWNRSTNRTAHWLRSLGVGRGDAVAVLAMNCVEYLELWFACGKLGAVLQTLNWRLTPAELAGLVSEVGPKVLVYGPDFVAQVQAMRAQGVKTRYMAIEGANRASPDDGELAGREGCPDTAPPEIEIDADHPWVLCYTGGSTGLPKGAILTHGNLFWNAVNTITGWGLTPQDVTFLNAPLFHTGGLNVLTAPFVQIGATTVVCRAFDPDQVFDLIEGHGITVFFGVPTMFVSMQAHPRWARADFSRLRWVVSGGAPCPLPVFEKFWAKGVEFKTGYGLTEAGPNTFWLPSERVREKPGAVGVPLMNVEVRVVDGEGNLCGPEEVGELHIRGPHVCAGYWRKPEETRKAIVDGWLHTGDLARRDGDGIYWIVGRSKDLIISGGENIYPAEVESVMAAHEAVAEAALIGVPDAKWGEVGLAVVVVKPGASLSEEGMIEFLRGRLGRYKVPKRVVFVEGLPKTGAGKVDKRALSREFGEG